MQINVSHSEGSSVVRIDCMALPIELSRLLGPQPLHALAWLQVPDHPRWTSLVPVFTPLRSSFNGIIPKASGPSGLCLVSRLLRLGVVLNNIT